MRRLRGGELLLEGYDVDEVVERTGASRSAVKRWKTQIKQGGLHALARKPNSGRPTSLTPEQFDQLKQIIRDGVTAYGFSNECWTVLRIVHIIFERFHVRCNFKYIPQLLHRLGLSCQKPDTQSPKRSQKAIDIGVGMFDLV